MKEQWSEGEVDVIATLAVQVADASDGYGYRCHLNVTAPVPLPVICRAIHALVEDAERYAPDADLKRMVARELMGGEFTDTRVIESDFVDPT